MICQLLPLYYHKFTIKSLNVPCSSSILSENVTPDTAAYLSTLFDVGGIAGGIAAGLISDSTGKSASTCAIMLVAAIPSLLAYESYGTSCPLTETLTGSCYAGNVGLLLTVGFLVNGPYALI